MSLINIEIELDKVFSGQIIEKNNKRYVCLDDLKGSQIYQHPSKKITKLKLNVSDRKEVSQYGQTHNVSLGLSKDEREKKGTIYVGEGKAYVNNTQQATTTATAANEDLPF